MQTIARGITYADLNFLGKPRIIAAAAIDSPGGVALVDPGPSTCLETLRAALSEQGITLADVRAILLTHIHLDHAGATGTLVRDNPEIQVYVHERGARHMADPAKLITSATRLYGDDMDRLWGEFLPVPQDNIHALVGGERIRVADRDLAVAYTPGHASHHVSYFDRASGVAFVGDTAGIRTGPDLFAMPPTPPPDIDIEVWKASAALISDWQADTLFLTHFGPHGEPASHMASLLEHLDGVAGLARAIVDEERDAAPDARVARFVADLRHYLQRHMSDTAAARYDKAAPLDQCWLGLERYWTKRGV
ncbi:MAG: MBL fold metallo-hydrolase [Acidobacteria bacterium]|nr:MBL fold metallo-hydrolase [Acidobacteriota bacterium]